MLRKIFISGMVLLMASSAMAKVVIEKVIYKDGDVELEGLLAYDNSTTAAKPGVLIVHDWMGPGTYSEKRARQLASEGYVAFAADVYGKNVRPANREEAGKVAGGYKADRPLLRKRVALALETLRKQKRVENSKVAAIGYCFGGTAVLELARSGAKLNGVVSFHGGLDTPKPDETKQVHPRVLVLHGAADPSVPPAQVQTFEKEMTQAKADWQLVAYGGAVHSFTNPSAGNDPTKGNAYDEKADRRSWIAMKSFFTEIF